MGTLKGNIRSIRQLREIFKSNDFSFIHVHSPLGSILGRFVAKQFKVPAIYTAHGFHFFKGGPKSGWLVFYPLEWFFAFITDTLITINDEDYELAEKHMHAKNVIKINGIGVEIEKAWSVSEEKKVLARETIRRELGIPEKAFLISSVGELSHRKNHKIVLEALKILSPEQRRSIYYVIAGTGDNKNMLNDLAKSFQFEGHFKLLGYRSDVHDINYASDVFVFPSLQEGLGIAGLEATVDGTFLIGSMKRGIADYIENNNNGIILSKMNYKAMAQALETVFVRFNNEKGSIQKKHYDFLSSFDCKSVDNKMRTIYIKEIGLSLIHI